MSTLRSYACVVLMAAATAGCGGQRSVGEPMAPTSSQMQAATQATMSIDQFSSIKANPQNALSIQGQIAAMGALAIDPSRRQGLNGSDGSDLAPAGTPPGCISGDAATGYTYTDCTSSSGSGSSTVNGTVKVTGDTVAMDLKITASGSGANVEITLKGSVTVTATTITGQMVYETKIAGVSGLPGVGATGTKYTVTYDATYSANPVCITKGSVRVDVDGALSGSALFEWTGCGMYTVRNG